ncbi:hypothetical protein LB456_11565 [Psychroflexus sp. CAK57W]|nr:hypothetical protein [Psychroflexus curvus]MBZ9628457.1 hypothetical protein [Psychroflexus curvus]MBZ9788096.1 hypothetical protein [Psychroflexus curvus]
MAKIYSNEVSELSSKPVKPSAKTIKSILDFSKALSIVRYKDLQFDSIQN